MLTGFGYAVDRDQGVISLEGGGSLHGTDIDIPADISSAAFSGWRLDCAGLGSHSGARGH